MHGIWKRFSTFVTAKPTRPRVSAIAFVMAAELAVSGGVYATIHAIAH